MVFFLLVLLRHAAVDLIEKLFHTHTKLYSLLHEGTTDFYIYFFYFCCLLVFYHHPYQACVIYIEEKVDKSIKENNKIQCESGLLIIAI